MYVEVPVASGLSVYTTSGSSSTSLRYRSSVGAQRLERLGELGSSLVDALLERLDVLPKLRGHVVEGARELADLVLRHDGCLAGEVARGDGARRVGDGEYRSRDPARRVVDRDPEERDDEEPGAAGHEGQSPCGCERLALALLGEERRADLGEPLVHADHGHAARGSRRDRSRSPTQARG